MPQGRNPRNQGSMGVGEWATTTNPCYRKCFKKCLCLVTPMGGRRDA